VTRKTSNRADRQIKQGDTKQVVSQQVHYSGPLPPSTELDQYNQILPGAAERILAMAESEAKHRHALENQQLLNENDVIKKTFSERRIGQMCGLFVGVFAIAAGVYAAVMELNGLADLSALVA